MSFSLQHVVKSFDRLFESQAISKFSCKFLNSSRFFFFFLGELATGWMQESWIYCLCVLGDKGKSRYWLEVLGVGIFGSPFHFPFGLTVFVGYRSTINGTYCVREERFSLEVLANVCPFL